MRYLLFLVLVLFLSGAKAQTKPINSEYYSNLTPRPPERYKLGTFGDVPINFYTGLPEVSLPLMMLEGRETKVPITLNYDASGIRTDDVSGSVGMKWSLQAGGTVERDVNGLPDELPETGFWQTASTTDYFRSGDKTDWVTRCQKNTHDTAPDEFAVVVDGRSFRFVFDKRGIARVYPRQNVRINYTLATVNSRVQINQFELILENGRKYIFGGTSESVEMKKIETLRVGTSFNHKQIDDCPREMIDNHMYVKCQGYTWAGNFSKEVDFKVTSIPFFASKWHLTSIVEPTGETTSFQYVKLSDRVYTTRPGTMLIRPVVHYIDKYNYKHEYCPNPEVFGECIGGTQTDWYHFSGIWAVTKFPTTYPGSAPYSTLDHFNPLKYPTNPGAVNAYHTLITENTIRLTQITSSTKNRIVFGRVASEDLPGSYHYDRITLYNMNGHKVKAIRLNFATMKANEANDRLWISEALLLNQFEKLTIVDPNAFYANYVKQYHTAAEIANENYRKFIFEGLKDYNYKRSFLSIVEDITFEARPIQLYRFQYQDTDVLRRRTTPYHDAYGFHRTSVAEEEFYFRSSYRAAIAQSYNPNHGLTSNRAPLAGMLTSIQYPTNGSTRFIYQFKIGVRLVRIEDRDENDSILTQRELEYVKSAPNYGPVITSYQDFKVDGTSGWMKYMVTSSSPQNEPYHTQGTFEANDEVIMYHGTKSANNGFERFHFVSTSDLVDVVNIVRSHPVEKDSNNSVYVPRNIFPFPKNSHLDHLRGYLTLHQIYKAGSALDKPLKEVAYQYEKNPYGYDPVVVYGFKGGSYMWSTSESTNFFYGSEVNAERRYRWGWNTYSTDWTVLKLTKETRYDEEDPTRRTVNVTEYEYDSIHLQQIKKITYNERSPTQRTIEIKKFVTHPDYVYGESCNTVLNNCRTACIGGSDECYKECEIRMHICIFELGSTDVQALATLRKKMQFDIPIEIQRWEEVDGTRTLVSSVFYKFQKINPVETTSFFYVKPREVWVLSQPISASNYSESKILAANINDLTIDSRFRKVHTFNAYEPVTANLLSQTVVDGTTSDYVWEPASNLSTIRSHIVNPGTQQQESSFQEIPLVGVTMTTDPNKRSTSYKYDLRNRLKSVHDHNMNVRTSYRYHYASEAASDSINATFGIFGSLVAGNKIKFSCPADQREHGTTSYSWDFGDGSPIQQTTLSYIEKIFITAGNYNVTLTKSNPEYGSDSHTESITIGNPFLATVCVDGPSHIDIAPGNMSPVSGSCTTSMTSTKIRATVSGGCGGVTYRWEIQDQYGSWSSYHTGTSATGPAPLNFQNRVLGSYSVRCVAADSCGTTSISNVVTLVIF